jgi:hypothetical protein
VVLKFQEKYVPVIKDQTGTARKIGRRRGYPQANKLKFSRANKGICCQTLAKGNNCSCSFGRVVAFQSSVGK